MRKILLGIGLWLSLCEVMVGQLKLRGRVADEQGDAVLGVTILLLSGDTLTAGGISDTKGEFIIREVPKASYNVRLSAIGYKPLEQTLRLDNDRNLGTIRMEAVSYALDEVTVSGDQRAIIQQDASGSTFHVSEKLKAEAHNVYQALLEIPLLSVNETERSIKMVDGSQPIILINGVRKSGAEAAIDPRMIERVEVIENASSRYLAEEGVTSVLNIQVKRAAQRSQTVNLWGREIPNGKFGLYGGNYQLEQANLSFYANGMLFYFHHDDGEREGWSDSGSLLRRYKGTRRYNATNLDLNLGGDWLISERDQLIYGVNLINNPSKTYASEQGTQTAHGEETSYTASSYLNSDYFMGSYNLLYRHTFTSDRHLELTARANHYNTSPEGWREEQGERNSYRKEIQMENRRKVFRLEGNYDFVWPKRLAFNVGLNAFYQQARIADAARFDYKEAREYLYADMRSLAKRPFSYALSVGLDVVTRDASGANKSYVNFLPTLNLAYKASPSGTFRLNLGRQRTSPSLSALNPLNTSTDSLYVTEGNPYLLPELSNQATFSFAWNGKAVYLQPSVTYRYVQKRVQSVGFLVGDVYHRTYQNIGHAETWRVALTTRFNLGKYGNINLTPFFVKTNIPSMSFGGNAWGVNGNLYLSYKKVYLNAMVNYTSDVYTQISHTSSAAMTDATFGWNLLKGWSVTFSLRDNMACSRQWTRDGAYSSYVKTDFKDRHWTPMIGLSYYFQNKANLKQRSKKQLRNAESDSFNVTVE